MEKHVPFGSDSTRVSFIDVGKGDCILVQSGGQAALIDTGYADTSDSVLAHVHGCGVERLEFIALTHYDRDHVGGVGPIARALDTNVIYLPGYEGSDKHYHTLMAAVANSGVSARQVTENFSLKLGEAQLDFFPSRVKYIPASGKDEGNDNDLSLVMSLTSGNASYLFTGDMEEDGIAAYLRGAHGHFDILKVPHHGEKSSYTDEFLEDVRPQVAVITDSAEDPADKKVLKLLDEIGASVYRTSTHGTIVVAGDGAGGYSIS